MKKTLILSVLILFTSYTYAQDITLKDVVNTLKERITLSGYSQLGYTYDSAAEPNNTFDIKRIIFMAEGKITDKWLAYFMYDFYNGGMLLEVYTEYRFFPWLKARIGEFKTPYTIDNQLSPTSVELINCYSQSVCYLAGVSGSDELCGVTTGRDIGFMLHGDFCKQLFSYKLAVMNGQGVNLKDKNSQKDIIGSLMVNPLKWLSVGGSFVKGTGYASVTKEEMDIKAGENYTKNRWSAGVVVTTKPFNLRSEYLAGKDKYTKSDGFYATASYTVLPKFDIIASYDYFNQNKETGNKQTNYVAGVQYWFYPKCRLQAQYTYSDRKLRKNSNIIQAQVQVRF